MGCPMIYQRLISTTDQRLKLGTSVEAWRSEWENFIAVLRECHGKLNRDMLCGNDLRSPLLGRHS
jgi:hypothetical protein